MRLKLPRFLGVLLFCVIPPSLADEANNRNYANLHALYATYGEMLTEYLTPAILKNGVVHTYVDYASWATDARHSEIMTRLKKVNSDLLFPNERLAFWINAYNLLTLDLIIKEEERETIRNLGGVIRNAWRKHRWELNGETYSLHEIEHHILRHEDEARIHFAINCASLSCPDLYEEPYRGSRLEAQLLLQEQRFMTNPTKGMKVIRDEAGEIKEVRISKIFDWYFRDFGRAEILDLIKRYAFIEVKRDDIEIMDYDWSLNGDW